MRELRFQRLQVRLRGSWPLLGGILWAAILLCLAPGAWRVSVAAADQTASCLAVPGAVQDSGRWQAWQCTACRAYPSA
eukprot:CAMPEP_0179106250 /NCGR_PEP_ID=MMETSP0796-20121207/49393_1 /TAXON_ID=73915 /ORGANISM="Pyrodinium bahamense, Strain pbaha01" /LENGTH=77 /DNA_ID=CAMNT_0020804275 /DNA_START=130 /DNA_END=360 /DNA_ORIENTATION=-